jgi:hypothetical protein
MLNRMILVAAFLLMLVNQGMATYSVNETVSEYRISFESEYNTSLIVKGWNLQTASDFDFDELNDTLEVAEVLGVAALDTLNSPSETLVVGVLIFNESVDTAYAEKEILKKSVEHYLRVYDKTIDGHKGIYFQEGDGPDDPGMNYGGMYWLDEAADGTAKELVLIASPGPESSESAMAVLLNTVHVEKI